MCKTVLSSLFLSIIPHLGDATVAAAGLADDAELGETSMRRRQAHQQCSAPDTDAEIGSCSMVTPESLPIDSSFILIGPPPVAHFFDLVSDKPVVVVQPNVQQ